MCPVNQFHLNINSINVILIAHAYTSLDKNREQFPAECLPQDGEHYFRRDLFHRPRKDAPGKKAAKEKWFLKTSRGSTRTA